MMPQDFSGGDERGAGTLAVDGRTARALERLTGEIRQLRQAYESAGRSGPGDRDGSRDLAAHGRELLSPSRHHRRQG